jgi:hypothetical protein
VENPAIVADPYNGYDLVVSYGTWWEPNYETIELGCALPYGECAPNTYAVLLSQGGNGNTGQGNSYNSPGGMSFLFDGSPTGNVAVWHSYEFPGNPNNLTRQDWTGPTSSIQVQNVVGPINGPTPTPFVHVSSQMQVTPLVSATENPPNVIQDHWALRGLPPYGGDMTATGRMPVAWSGG